MSSKTALLFAALSAISIPGLALGEESSFSASHQLKGEHAVIFINETGLPQAITLKITNLTPGKSGMFVKYASPSSCRFDASYGGMVNDEHFFFPEKFSIRKCQNVIFGESHIRLKQGEDGSLQYTLNNGEGYSEIATSHANIGSEQFSQR